MPNFEALVDEAEDALRPIIRSTPVEYSPGLSAALGVDAFIKLESLQVTGSFKIRGAYFALKKLQQAGATAVATVSAGNHGVGMAYAGRLLGIPVRIYVPRSVDEAKARSLASMGADLVRSEFDGFDETEEWALETIARDGLPFISAYDDELIMAGNGGTLMREMRRQVPQLETVVVPVGGGGMSGGMVRSAARPDRLVAAQAQASPALALSLERGEAITRLQATPTLAGGLEGGIGQSGFNALKDRVAQVMLVSEEGLAAGVRWMLEHHRYLIEPSSGVAIAACLDPSIKVQGPTVVVVSGRNVAMDTLQKIMA